MFGLDITRSFKSVNQEDISWGEKCSFFLRTGNDARCLLMEVLCSVTCLDVFCCGPNSNLKSMYVSQQRYFWSEISHSCFPFQTAMTLTDESWSLFFFVNKYFNKYIASEYLLPFGYILHCGTIVFSNSTLRMHSELSVYIDILGCTAFPYFYNMITLHTQNVSSGQARIGSSSIWICMYT